MQPGHSLTFGPFRLDVAQGQLWRGAQALVLRPRSLAMLRYLTEHPGRQVTKVELRQHVWGGIHVTDTVLRVCVREIREVLGDVAEAPQYLATVGRQGYRFLVGDDREVAPPRLAGPIVGRQGEVNALAGWFQRVVQGTRQVVWISGEAWVGKTTVVEQWLSRLSTGGGVRIARGQCVEHYGEGEPYLPLLEALGHLRRGPDARQVLEALRRYAPMWLAQWPGLLPEAELQRLQRQLQGATAARRIREFAEVVEVLAAETPLVLALEDLHWSDHATVESLNYVAQRRVPVRLVEDVEARCEELASQGRFLYDIGLRQWPDGTSSGRYQFTHALYRQVLYEGLGTVRRQRIHIGASAAHRPASGGRLWRARGGNRRPIGRPLRAWRRDPAGRALLAAASPAETWRQRKHMRTPYWPWPLHNNGRSAPNRGASCGGGPWPCKGRRMLA